MERMRSREEGLRSGLEVDLNGREIEGRYVERGSRDGLVVEVKVAVAVVITEEKSISKLKAGSINHKCFLIGFDFDIHHYSC